MRVGVIFARSYKPFSLLIQATTVSRWSHCGMVIDNSVYEASAGEGVVKTPLQSFLKRYSSFDVLWIDADSKAEVIAASQLGKHYDWLGVLGVAFSRDWQEDDSWFCSEYVAWCLKQSGFEFEDDIWRVTPGYLYKHLLEERGDYANQH